MKIKRILSALLAGCVLLSMTACGGSTEAAPAETSGTTNTLDDDINNPVDISEVIVDTDKEKKLENPNLLYFSHYDARVAGDIKPGVKLFEETYGGKIDYMTVAWADRITKLAALIQSGDSPDLVDRETASFPQLMAKNLYTDLTGYIDLDSETWSGVKDLAQQYMWNGKMYYCPFTVNALPECLIYCSTLFDQYGMDDPRELYAKNEWDWDKFRELMIEFMDNAGEGSGGIYGLVSNNIMQTTGTPIIGMGEDGKITNNMGSPDIERAAAFLEGLRKEGLCVRGDGMWSNETKPLRSGVTAFLGVGQWKITDYQKVAARDGTEYNFVPYPRDPSADKYYYSASSFGYMVPSGSQNVEGAAEFLNIMRRCQTDPELKAIVKESIMKDKKYTEDQYEFLTSFEDLTKFDVVVDMTYGFSDELTSMMDNLFTNIAFEQGEEQQSWAVIRTTNEGFIDSTIEPYNAQLTA